MSDKFISLATYTYNTESYMLVAKLEAAGIKCFVKNENLVSTQQFLSNAVGGIDVQVKEEDLKIALPILKDLEAQTKAVTKLSGQLGKDYEKVLTYCNECEENNVYRKKGSVFSFGAKEHICMDCNHKWKQ